MPKLKKGTVAPSFQTTDFQGRPVDLNDYRGKKVLLSFYRYAACPLCNLRVHELKARFHEFEKQGLNMLAVFESPVESIQNSVGKQSPPLPVIPDPDRVLYRRYGVNGDAVKFLKGVLLQPGKVWKATINGFLPGKIENDMTMIPADFLIDGSGVIHTAYYGKDASDHLPIRQIEGFLNH